MKNLFLSLFLSIVSLGLLAQELKTDEGAVMILDRMSDVIGDLNSCSFTLTSSVDVTDHDFGVIKSNGISDVFLAGPNKMNVQLNGDKGHRGFWYNGSQFAYYSYDENNYAMVETPPTIMETIDYMNDSYGIEFPAADFFYPTFTDDILKNFSELRYLGEKRVNGQPCFHILAANNSMRVQIWVSEDSFNLPVKFVINYNDENHMQYEASFSNWQINPVLPMAMFEFSPPPEAAEITILSK